jgi:hypothetical protein
MRNVVEVRTIKRKEKYWEKIVQQCDFVQNELKEGILGSNVGISDEKSVASHLNTGTA